jgi:hypothetical protein
MTFRPSAFMALALDLMVRVGDGLMRDKRLAKNDMKLSFE